MPAAPARQRRGGATAAAADGYPTNGGHDRAEFRYVPRQSPSLSAQQPAAAASSSSSRSSRYSPATSTLPLTSAIRVPSSSGSGGRAVAAGFVPYLPQDEAVASGLGAEAGGIDAVESQAVVDHLNSELTHLLRLRPREFWREVATNNSLLEFLDSYLQFRHRWYDLPHRGPKGSFAGVVVGEIELSRRVFMVFYRISSNKEPGAGESLSANEHVALLQEKKLLDLPKLLDICAIYGHDNSELTSKLILNAVTADPRLLYGISSVVSRFLSIVQTMHDRCMSSIEVLSASVGCDDDSFGHLQKDFCEVLDFINDAIATLNAFGDAYRQAALFFISIDTSHQNEELLNTLARLHDSLLPSLLQGFKIISNSVVSKSQKSTGGGYTDVVLGVKLLSRRIIQFGWSLLDFCYLNDRISEREINSTSKMIPAKIEDPTIRGDILVQTLKDLTREATYTFSENLKSATFLQALEQDFELMGRINSLRGKGWLYVDDEQFQYLAQISESSVKASDAAPPKLKVLAPLSIEEQKTEDAILESEISQIRDLFPEYGKGFLVACLEAYNHNPEEVIQRILDGTLHQDLLSLGTSLERPLEKPETRNVKDKGKGLLVELDRPPLPQPQASKAKDIGKVDYVVPFKSEGPSSSSAPPSFSFEPLSSSSSSAPVGRFTRKESTNLFDKAVLDSTEAKEAIRSTVLSASAQYEYEDEYDDSFDDLGLSIIGSCYEETEKDDEEASTQDRNSGWASQKKPQFYVKDGKNYSYKVTGSVAVSNAREAALVNQSQRETIHGLGRGGNIPYAAVPARLGQSDGQGTVNSSSTATFGRGRPSNSRAGTAGRRQGGVVNTVDSEEEDEAAPAAGNPGRGGPGARGGGRRGGGRNNYRKDRAMKKHMAGLGGY